MCRIILVLGGARSGKSAFALMKASALPGTRAFIATAEALDDEMRTRVAAHRRERGNDWETFEEPVEIASLIGGAAAGRDVVIVDCLTLWVSNLMMRSLPFHPHVERLLSALSCRQTGVLYVVSNEVGLGLIPDNPLGREYRDNIGYLNAQVASVATDVYFLAAGIPMKIKETRSDSN